MRPEEDDAGNRTARAWAILFARLVLGLIFFYPFHEHVFPRLALLLFVLVLPAKEDRFSIDGWIRSRRGTG